MHYFSGVVCDMQVNQLLSIQKLLRLLRIARIIKLIKGFKVTTIPLLSAVATLLLHPTLPLPASILTESVNPQTAFVSKSCQTHTCLQLRSISMSIHASALCMQSPPAGDSRTAKRRAAQLVGFSYCTTGPTAAAAAVICSVTLSHHACWPYYLAMLACQQETLTASICGQQRLCRLEMPSCSVGMSTGCVNSQKLTQNATVFEKQPLLQSSVCQTQKQ